jgi:pentatricopeptide repeat protein
LGKREAKGLEPDVITYSALINACAKGDYAEMTVQPLVEMQRKGLGPNVITLHGA